MYRSMCQSALLVATISIALGACMFHTRSLSSSADDDSDPGDAPPPIPDAGVPPPTTGDGSSPSAPSVTMSETTSDVVTAGLGALCATRGGQTTADETWYRAFRPADFGVTGDFHVSSVRFTSAVARNAQGIIVSVGTYTGSLGADTLTTTEIHLLANASIDIPDSPTPQRIGVPTQADIDASALLIVQVAAPNLGTTDGKIYLGATSGGETHPGYFSSQSCFTSQPQSETALGISGHFIIDVVVDPKE